MSPTVKRSKPAKSEVTMESARLRVELQAILVLSLLLSPSFLPCALVAGELVAGTGREKRESHLFAPSKSTQSRRILRGIGSPPAPRPNPFSGRVCCG
ncbi:hypothetical protein GUJ93_ZPchr0006g45142 [Zizania palustris]|uniref:Uncharacterized protein n=1 Tax=Zizania palustris TaxID=103762 RepID=A0A8J5SE41_ZIZPA|nr:hypothetical protein GUJ93_ZPchr0006g45142 [Zizania palustris]